MKKAIRAVVSGFAAFGTTAAYAVPYDESVSGDLGNTFGTRTVLSNGIDQILGNGDDDYFEFSVFGSAAPFSLEFSIPCADASASGSVGSGDASSTGESAAESGTGGGTSECAPVELGPVLVAIGDSAVDAVFEYGFLSQEMFSVRTNADSSAGGSDATSGSESASPGGSDASSPTSSDAESGTGTGGTVSGSETITPSSGTTSLGPVYSFYDDKGDLVVSFSLPAFSPISPFVISGRGQVPGLVGRLQTTGQYTIDARQSSTIPEPVSGALLGAAAIGVGLSRRRKDQKK